jgi:transposase
MELHGNARLTPRGRMLMCERVRIEDWTVSDAAEASGCSERTCYRWLARYDAGQPMTDRSSAPHRVPRRTPQSIERQIERLRRLRWTSTRIAAELGLATSTVCAVLARLGLNRLSRLEPPEPPNRYWRRHPGELIHIDIKKLGMFRSPGHRVTGRGMGRRSHAGWEYCHVAVDDTSRLAYVEVLENEQAQTCIGFLRRAGHDRQRIWLSLTRSCKGCGRPRDQAPAHPPLATSDQRQSRTLHPDAPGRMGLRRQLFGLSASSKRASHLARVLQLQATTQRPWPQTARQRPSG